MCIRDRVYALRDLLANLRVRASASVNALFRPTELAVKAISTLAMVAISYLLRSVPADDMRPSLLHVASMLASRAGAKFLTTTSASTDTAGLIVGWAVDTLFPYSTDRACCHKDGVVHCHPTRPTRTASGPTNLLLLRVDVAILILIPVESRRAPESTGVLDLMWLATTSKLRRIGTRNAVTALRGPYCCANASRLRSRSRSPLTLATNSGAAICDLLLNSLIDPIRRTL